MARAHTHARTKVTRGQARRARARMGMTRAHATAQTDNGRRGDGNGAYAAVGLWERGPGRRRGSYVYSGVEAVETKSNLGFGSADLAAAAYGGRGGEREKRQSGGGGEEAVGRSGEQGRIGGG